MTSSRRRKAGVGGGRSEPAPRGRRRPPAPRSDGLPKAEAPRRVLTRTWTRTRRQAGPRVRPVVLAAFGTARAEAGSGTRCHFPAGGARSDARGDPVLLPAPWD
eukprot:144914-Chlamydomonas_euryale.AAC.1